VALAADDPELVAEARIALAAIDVSRRQWSGAAQQLEQALAIAPRRDDLVFEALVAWATVDSQRNRLDEASRHLDRAQPVGARLTGDPGHAGAVLLGRAQVAHAGHRPEATLELATEAARGLERAAGGQPKRLATAWRLIAAARVDLAQSDEALEACRMCTRTIESAYGASHPEVSQCLLCEGMALESLGRYDETMARLQRAVALTQPLGADNPRRALLLAYQGRIAESRGHVDAAVELHARAVEAASRTERPDPWLLGATLDNLARAHAAAGDRDTAATMFARALTNL
jgi:tetratricopeptide (TPR) repeat protein